MGLWQGPLGWYSWEHPVLGGRFVAKINIWASWPWRKLGNGYERILSETIWIYLKHIDKLTNLDILFQTVCFPNFREFSWKGTFGWGILGIPCFWAFRNGPKAAMTQSWDSHRVPFWQQHFAPDCWRKGKPPRFAIFLSGFGKPKPAGGFLNY